MANIKLLSTDSVRTFNSYGKVPSYKYHLKQEMFVENVCPTNNVTVTLTFDLKNPNSIGVIY